MLAWPTVQLFVLLIKHNFKGSPTLILVASMPVTNTSCAAAKATQRLRWIRYRIADKPLEKEVGVGVRKIREF